MKLATTDVFKTLSRINKELVVLSDEQLRTVQRIELETLTDVLAVCEEKQISYHLTGGSALGAVRHHGFIPWDDDVDIDMVRKDVSRFLAAFEERYGEKYWIHTCRSKGVHCIPGIAIQRKHTVFQGCTDPVPEECGVSMDVAIIENTYDNPVLRTVHGIGSMTLGFIVSCRRFAMNREYLMRLAGDREDIRKVFQQKARIGTLFSFRSLESWIRQYDRWNAKCRDDHSRYVAVPVGRKHFFGELYLREDFAESMDGVFENLKVKLPKNIDKYLRHMYGRDYRIVPPPEKREQHTLVRFEVNL